MNNGSRSKRAKKMSGDEALSLIAAITIILENGDHVQIDPARELEIPASPGMREKALVKAPARCAFMAAQTERALAAVRRAEHELAVTRGTTYEATMRFLKEEKGEDFVANDRVQAWVDASESVQKCRNRLDLAREHYGILRSLARALDQRCNALNRLVARRDFARGDV